MISGILQAMNLKLIFQQSDAELAKSCAKGDRKGQRLLYEKYEAKMFGVAKRYSSSMAQAEDILHDGFIKIFEKIGQFTTKGSLEGWMRTVIVSVALRTIQKEKSNLYIELNESLHDGALCAELGNLEAQDILSIIAKLPSGYRAVLNLYAIEGYSHAEIAKKLKISVGTSKSQLARSRNLLRELIQKNFNYGIEGEQNAG